MAQHDSCKTSCYRKIEGNRPLHKSLHLAQRMHLFVVQVDHRAPHHDRSQSPAQTQTLLDKVPACIPGAFRATIAMLLSPLRLLGDCDPATGGRFL